MKCSLASASVEAQQMQYLLLGSFKRSISQRSIFPQDFEIVGWCPVGPVLPHGEKVPL